MKAIIVAGHGRLYPNQPYPQDAVTIMWSSNHRLCSSTIRHAGINDITIGNKFIDKIREHVGSEVKYVLRAAALLQHYN